MQSSDHRGAQPIVRFMYDHGAYLRGLARRLCRSTADAEDLVQDVFEKLMVSPIPRGVPERAWVGRVMRNAFIDMVRKQRVRQARVVPLTRVLPLTPPPADERVWWQELDETHVQACLHQLPACQRTAFELFAFAGTDYEGIAAQLGVAKATVGTRILRARRKLRSMLVEAYGAAA